ncbi:Magnesium and cobalt efflux protein CorC [Thalassocella blandensis]|nr:Magnesium and cobalt efflux protein CorC [Thalassocella blandensis]
MLLLILYISLALGFSFICSVLEAVLLSISPSYIASQLQQGKKEGLLWQSFKTDIDRPLAAILSLNTIAHTVGAAGAGAQATKIFGDAFFGVISAVLTFLILVFSEIIPKTLGANYWRNLAPVSARVLVAVMWIMHPLVVMSKVLTKLMAKKSGHSSINREEFTALAEVGVKEGVFSEEESDAVKSLMRFRALTAYDIMTPRSVMFMLNGETSIKDTLTQFAPLRFSRIPIYLEETDNITGYVRKDDLLLAAIEKPNSRIDEFKRDIFTIPFSLPLNTLMRRMIETANPISLLVNEYGDVLGIVTMEDLIETMLGLEIVDETDSSNNMQALARELWLKRAKKLGIVAEDFKEADEQL